MLATSGIFQSNRAIAAERAVEQQRAATLRGAAAGAVNLGEIVKKATTAKVPNAL